MNKDPHITDANFSTGETKEQIKEKVRTHPDNYWTLRNKLILVTTAVSTVSLGLSLFSLILVSKVAYTNVQTQRELRAQDYARQEEFGNRDFKRQRALKEADLRQNCQRRYDDLAYETKARVKSESDAKGYYKRFWDLQFEQYQYCKDGLIDPKIFATWMDSRRLEFRNDEPVGKMGYQAGWHYMAEHFKDHDDVNRGAGSYTEFVNFMNDVFQAQKTTCDPESK